MGRELTEKLYSALQNVVIPNILNHNSFRYKTRADGTREYYKRRSNLIDDQPLHSCVFGLVTSPKWGWDVRPSVMARKYPEVERLLREYAREHIPDFPYTTITVNHNLKCKKHLDTSNHGASAITSVGDFTGGELNIATGDTHIKFDTHNRFVVYDGGRCAHWNEDIIGDKYSIVYYCNRSILQRARKHAEDPRFEVLSQMTAASADIPYYANLKVC